MKIDGKAIAEGILNELKDQVTRTKVTPTLAVILVGEHPESLAYIRQKKIATEKIGGRFIFEQLPAVTTQKELDARVAMFNDDPAINGLIVQRPMAGLIASVKLTKDIDGFEPGSPFGVPIAMAVFLILKDIDVKNKKIVIIGKGETAGKPIAEAFADKQCATSVIDTKTPNPEVVMKSADILISCVGKRVIEREYIKPGAFLISVGIHTDGEGKLHGDYEDKEIANIAGFYTPTPGGVGPINIACLMQNLVKACKIKL